MIFQAGLPQVAESFGDVAGQVWCEVVWKALF